MPSKIGGWYNAWADEPILICPTHWRIWRKLILRARALFEPRYEDSAFFLYIAHSHACARSRRNTGKATDRRREAARSGDAEGALPMHI
jgi:hypothetical protein